MSHTLSRRVFLQASAAALLSAAVGPAIGQVAATGAGKRPNIIFIMADDLGLNDLSCYGSQTIRTPAIDSLATGGVLFTRAYCAAPECSPTRTALLTGRYPQRAGGLECAIGIGGVGRYDDAIRLAEQNELGLPPAQSTLAQSLKQAGYRTAICGKWHLGYDAKFAPLRHGFDHFFGPIGAANDYFHHTEPDGRHILYENDQPVEREGYLTDLISDDAVRFINRQSAETPFFLYVPYTAPHDPYQGPDDYRDTPLTDAEWKTAAPGTYAAMVEAMDRGVAAILRALEEKQLAGNTLVIFTSDNGANPKGSNAPLTGHKGALFEGGIRAPAVARWPGVIAPGTRSDLLVTTMDWTASLLAAGGAASVVGALDGIDVLGHLREGKVPAPRPLFWRARRGENTLRAVRDGELKYISVRSPQRQQEYLFDLDADPGEKQNLVEERPDELVKLKGLLQRWEEEVRPVR